MMQRTGNFGTKFSVRKTGEIIGIKFYKHPNENGVHVGRIWDANNKTTPLVSVEFKSETSAGWQLVYLNEPLVIDAFKNYVVTVNINGYLVFDDSFFSNQKPPTNDGNFFIQTTGVFTSSISDYPTQYSNNDLYSASVLLKSCQCDYNIYYMLQDYNFTEAKLQTDADFKIFVNTFRVINPGYVIGFTYFKHPDDTETNHVGKLWDPYIRNTPILTKQFVSETASGWQKVNLDEPFYLVPGKDYFISVNAKKTYFFENFFTPGPNKIPFYDQNFILTAPSFASETEESEPSLVKSSLYSTGVVFLQVCSECYTAVMLPTNDFSDKGAFAGNFGTKFHVLQDAKIIGFRYTKLSSDLSSHIARLWDPNFKSAPIVSRQFNHESSEGIQTVYLQTPYPIKANKDYVVTINSNGYAYNAGFFNNHPSPFTDGNFIISSTGLYIQGSTQDYPTTTSLNDLYSPTVIVEFCNFNEKGEKGDSVRGEKGEPGLKGDKGENGRVVQHDNNNNEGKKGNDGQKGNKGEKGEKGKKGSLDKNTKRQIRNLEKEVEQLEKENSLLKKEEAKEIQKEQEFEKKILGRLNLK